MSKMLGLSSLGSGNRFAVEGRGDIESKRGAPRDIVEEMAAALANFTPPPGPATSYGAPDPSSANVPAPLPINDFEDDFPDDEPVSLPSAWLKQPPDRNRNWLGEQSRAVGYGLALGLAVVVPLALILSGYLGDFSRVDLANALQPPKPSAAKSPPVSTGEPRPMLAKAAADTQGVAALKPRLVVTTPVVAAPAAADPPVQPVEARVVETKPMEATLAAVAIVPPAPQPVPQRDERAEITAAVAARIAAGDIVGARDLLGRAAASGDSTAFLSLAETFDPNMLAAWGAKGVTPDVGAARSYYRRALAAGVAKAQMRLDALE